MEVLGFNRLNTGRCLSFVTTRNQGVSPAPFNSLNLSFNVHDTIENVTCNRLKVAEYLQIGTDNLIFPNQCHTSNITEIYKPAETIDLSETDALITSARGIALGVLSADCVPLVFYDSEKQIIAAVHAGWRGTCKNITGKVLDIFYKRYGSLPGNILAGIGPAISLNNYEVDGKVVLKLKNLGSDVNKFVVDSQNPGHFKVDLQGINKSILISKGIPEENIETISLCTYERNDLFFSARRDGFETGRFAAIIILK